MATCTASVTARFTPAGRITFTVRINGCRNSQGDFSFTYVYTDDTGTTRSIPKRETWLSTHGSSTATAVYDAALSRGEVMKSVSVNEVRCTCNE
jgi:hypothetical protein